MPDLGFREYAIIVPLILLMLWMGSYTQSFLTPISASDAVLLGPIDARREIHVQARPPKAPTAVAGELARELGTQELGTQELNHAR